MEGWRFVVGLVYKTFKVLYIFCDIFWNVNIVFVLLYV